MNKILKAIKNPYKLIYGFLLRNISFSKRIEDETYLGIAYRSVFGRKINWKEPQMYNEKLQWLKINYRQPSLTKLVDKYEVKEHVASKIGREYIIPTLAVWNNIKDIDIEKLPEKFVLKCTHDSGGVVICKEKNNFDFKTAKEKLEISLNKNFYWMEREWPYKNVQPRIIAEEYIEDKKSKSLNDYKIFCFNGNIDSIMVCKGREKGHPDFYFYDINWNRLIYQKLELEKGDNIEKPHNLSRMIELTKILSQGFPHVRVDFYDVDEKLYFGELTFFDQSGFDTDILPATDAKWGKLLKLPL